METNIGLRNSHWALIHLPSDYTKRKLSERFCFISEWELKAASDDSYPPIAEFRKRMNDNECIGDERLPLWPE